MVCLLGDTTMIAAEEAAEKQALIDAVATTATTNTDKPELAPTDTATDPSPMDTSPAVNGANSNVAMETDVRPEPVRTDNDFKIPLAIETPAIAVTVDQTSNSDQSESDAPSRADSEMDVESGIGDEMDEPNPFIRRSGNTATTVTPSPAAKYRLMCQCGAANCRKYLY